MRRILYQANSQVEDAHTHLETQRMGPIDLGRGKVLAVWQRIARPRKP
jgi:hypothetical protein